MSLPVDSTLARHFNLSDAHPYLSSIMQCFLTWKLAVKTWVASSSSFVRTLFPKQPKTSVLYVRVNKGLAFRAAHSTVLFLVSCVRGKPSLDFLSLTSTLLRFLTLPSFAAAGATLPTTTERVENQFTATNLTTKTSNYHTKGREFFRWPTPVPTRTDPSFLSALTILHGWMASTLSSERSPKASTLSTKSNLSEAKVVPPQRR